jgi:hypothetical protein
VELWKVAGFGLLPSFLLAQASHFDINIQPAGTNPSPYVIIAVENGKLSGDSDLWSIYIIEQNALLTYLLCRN